MMPITTLKKLDKSKSNLISTNMKMTNFISEVIDAIGVPVANITMGSNRLSFTFFVMNAKPTYSVLLGRDWIHFNQSIPSTLHQLLMFWDKGKVKVVPVDNNHFSTNITMAKSIFYSTQVKPIIVIDDFEERSVESCDLTS